MPSAESDTWKIVKTLRAGKPVPCHTRADEIVLDLAGQVEKMTDCFRKEQQNAEAWRVRAIEAETKLEHGGHTLSRDCNCNPKIIRPGT